MNKKYLSKIIATDNEGLQVISACCSGAEVKADLKLNIFSYKQGFFIINCIDLK